MCNESKTLSSEPPRSPGEAGLDNAQACKVTEGSEYMWYCINLSMSPNVLVVDGDDCGDPLVALSCHTWLLVSTQQVDLTPTFEQYTVTINNAI